MTGLSKRQGDVLEFIRAFTTEHGYPPTIREISKHLGVRSTNAVVEHVRRLERKGFLRVENTKSRALRLTDPGDGKCPLCGGTGLASVQRAPEVDLDMLHAL